MSEGKKGPEFGGEPQPEKVKRKVERVEMGSEHIPSKEEVQGKFEEYIGEAFKESKIEEDEQGLYLWEVIVPSDKEGTYKEYCYRRGVGGPQSMGKKNSIDVTYYEDEMPVNGDTLADCVEGVWIKK